MKYLMLIAFLTLSFVTQAKLYTVKPGERKVVTIKTFGAVTASSVSLSGVEGVSASLGRKLGADKVEVILNAASNAWGGSGKINLRLAAGTNVSDLYVYSMPRIQINKPNQTIAGRTAKVKLTWVHPDAQLAAVGYGTYAPIYRLTKVGNASYEFEVTTRNNESATRKIRLIERGQEKSFDVKFVKDNSIPTNLIAPTYPSSQKTKRVSTRNRTANVAIKWNARSGANSYIVGLKKYSDSQFREFTVNSGTSTTLRDLPIGQNRWYVKAVYDPAKTGSTLTKVVSPQSQPADVFVSQNSVENKPIIKKRRG